MGFKIIRTKTWKKLQADLDELRGAYKNLHELQKGLYQKYLTETKQRDQEIEELNKKLKRAEHEKAEAKKKLKKYETNKKS